MLCASLGGHWSFKIVSWGGRSHKRFLLMSRGPKCYKTAILSGPSLKYHQTAFSYQAERPGIKS